MRPGQGRSGDLTVEGFLVVLMLTIEFRHSLEIAELAHTYLSLPSEVQRGFGVPQAVARRRNRQRALEDHCYRLWERLGHALDTDPVTRPWLLPEERTRMREEIARLMSDLASGMVPAAFPRETLSADGTALHSYGNKRFGGDPHARVGFKTPTDGDPMSKYFGFKVVPVVRTRTKGKSSEDA